MATRNRTPLYRNYREALPSVRPPTVSSPLTQAGPSSSPAGRTGPVIEMVSTSLLRHSRSYAALSTEDPGNSRGYLTVGLPPPWVELSEEIYVNMQTARRKMSELMKAHEKALMPSFGDGNEDQHAIEALTQEITNLLKRSEKRLMKLSSTSTASSGESNITKNVQRSLATDLQNLSMELRKKQSIYLKRLREQKEGQDGIDLDMNISGAKSNIFEDDEFDDIDFSGHQMSQLKKNEAFTIEREREIAQVTESVNELAQIMKDISILVIDQGTIIDRIDYNIHNVASTVEQGFKQLRKAERNPEKRRNGCVRYSPSDNVLRYANPSNSKGNILINAWSMHL